MEYQGLEINHFNHDTFEIKLNDKIIYLDPYNLESSQIKKADYIFITHQHHDHCSIDDIKKIASEKTVIIASKLCKETLKDFKVKRLIIASPNEKLELDDLKVQTVPAYNLDKWRSAGVPYHPKEEKHTGFVIDINGVKVYHTGDTDNIPEMTNLAGQIDIFLVPVSGKYVMTWQEAAEACRIIKPKLAIPMHYGSIVGTQADAEKFKQAVSTQVEII